MIRFPAAIGGLLLWAVILYIPFWTGHVDMEGDGYFHNRAVVQIAQAQTEGTVYPQWLPEQRGGLGDPSFVYYPPLFHTASALIDHAVGNAWTAMKAAMLLSTALAGVIAFLYLRTLFPMHLALLGALAIEANPLPIHQMAKGGLYSANVVYPLVLLCLIMLIRIKPKSWVSPGLALSVCALTLTHVLTCFMLCITIPAGIMVHSILRKEQMRASVSRLVQSCLSIGLGICLAGFYIVPALTTLQYISPDQWVLSGPCSMERSFLLPFYTHKFGFCWESVQIGFPLAATVGLVIAALYVRRIEKRHVRFGIGLLICIGAWALFLGSDLSYPMWQVHSPLQKLQFPDRFNAVILPAALLALTLATLYSWRQTSRARISMLLAATLSVPVVVSGLLVADLLRLPAKATAPDKPLGSEDTARPEYLPAVAKPGYRDYLRAGSFAGECRRLGISCETLQTSSSQYRFRIDTKKPVTVRLPLFAYPAWATFVDGRRLSTIVDANTGVIRVSLPPGAHDIRLRWTMMPQQWLGIWISIVALIVTGLLFWSTRKRTDLEAQWAAVSASISPVTS